jgi:hypothetical protein
VNSPPPRTAAQTAQLRAWLEYVAQTAIDMLDALDAADEDREPEEDGEDIAA